MDIDNCGKVYDPEDNFRIAPKRQLCGDEHDRIDRIRKAAIEFKDVIMSEVPASRERSLALTHLEDSVMRSVRGITE